ncbi:hypothetical protein ODJ79_11690 [Actinoplanes sp. KI2]|uniref:hypothetical protein n=1 Tax=Actinoplanes sp. KI2 TaxID=2983315 RepID=UPI0021D5A6C9|nr:hypothetical protein [Actinoplanes sp. KI2]MCU7724379.1 hypothetical protein [Actinoplanes sp. KI2]
MTNFDHDPLTAAFDEFRNQAAPLVKPVGADRTREVMRTRNRNRTITIAALAALVVAIPLMADAVLTGDPHGPPANSSVAPDPSASGEPYFIGPGESTHPSTTAPAGGITEAALYSATLNLPAWAAEMGNVKCPTGPVRLRNGDTQSDGVALWIAGVAYADVDRDGRAETFARVFCMNGPNDVGSQVVAFTPGPGGEVRTVGSVLQQGGDVDALCGVRAGASGTVQVEIADFPVPWRCADPSSANERYVTRQWLTFGWNGSAFVQQGTAAHTTNAYATDLELTSSNLVLSRQGNGHYAGSMTLTVRNTGTSAIPYKTDTLIADDMRLVNLPHGCSATLPGGGMTEVVCTGAKLAGGTTRRITLHVDSPRRHQKFYFDPATDVIPLEGYNDPNQANDRAALTIEFRD